MHFYPNVENFSLFSYCQRECFDAEYSHWAKCTLLQLKVFAEINHNCLMKQHTDSSSSSSSWVTQLKGLLHFFHYRFGGEMLTKLNALECYMMAYLSVFIDHNCTFCCLDLEQIKNESERLLLQLRSVHVIVSYSSMVIANFTHTHTHTHTYE